MRFLLMLLACATPALVFAQDMDLPRPRPEPPVVTEEVVPSTEERPLEVTEPASNSAARDEVLTTPEGEPLPRPRPEDADEPPVVEEPAAANDPAEPDVEVTEPEAPVEGVSEPVEPEPEQIYQTMCPAVTLGLIEAEALPPIADDLCTVRSPLSVTAVRVGNRMVPLSSPATLGCEMAMTLSPWAEAVDGVLWARENTRLAEITVGTSYMCRPRNTGMANDTVSEHGFADALDVVGFSFEDGRSITVLEGWAGTDAQGSRMLRFAHEAGCSLFSTVLGPESNELHRDHLHLDQGCHGSRCTARLCE